MFPEQHYLSPTMMAVAIDGVFSTIGVLYFTDTLSTVIVYGLHGTSVPMVKAGSQENVHVAQSKPYISTAVLM